MKIVVVAPNVSENLSGEAIKAFQYIKYLIASGVDATLLTHERSRGHLDNFPEALQVRYIEDDFWQLFVWKSVVFRSLIDLIFFLRARKVIAQINAEAPETVFHFLGPVSPVLPRFPPSDAKCVLGPITGNIYFPPALRSREPFSLQLRRIMHLLAQRLVGMVLKDKALFDSILVSGGDRTRQSLKWAGGRDERMHDVFDSGISDEILGLPMIDHVGENYRFVLNGRLVPHKGADLAISALAKTTTPATLDIFGKGPMEPKLRALVKELNLEKRVTFRGWLPNHDDLIREMTNYRGFVFPSMAEANGIVIQEALALGLPVLCLKWGGGNFADHRRNCDTY